VPSRGLGAPHDVLVYLPPCYQQQATRRFPVLYLQDGQNVFDGETAFVAGQEWFVDESAEALIRRGQIRPLIIVAIYNAGVHRIEEYTPTRDPQLRRGGKAYLYGKFLIQELKPMIDATYRTLRGRRHTAIGGSSLGGLVSLYLGLKHPQVFGRVAALSPSIWWDNRVILKMVRAFDADHRPAIWFDTGTREGGSPARILRDSRALRDELIQKGWRMGRNLAYFEAVGADHSEASWARRVPTVLRFFYRSRTLKGVR
jgi:predicted alpha/beta superfamily hydrolase